MINLMNPALYGIFCLQDSSPLVLMKNSIGIFRHDEPDSASDWRHLWLKTALQDWPDLSIKMFNKGWLNKIQLKNSINIFSHLLTAVPYRPDILLGFRKKYEISFIKLLKLYKFKYLRSIFLSLSKSFIEVLKRIFVLLKLK